MHTDSRNTALDLMMDLMPAIRKLEERISIHDRGLALQLRSSSRSVVLNHAEADGNFDGNRRIRIQQAYGSLHETRKNLMLAVAFGYVPRDEVDRVDAGLDRVGAMSWRRMHSKR